MMHRERIVEEKRRLIRVQAGLLKASREIVGPAENDIIDAVAQLTLVVSALLKEVEE